MPEQKYIDLKRSYQWRYDDLSFKFGHLLKGNGMSAPTVESNGVVEARKIFIDRGGDRIVLPEGMEYLEARKCLEMQEAEENTLVNVSEKIRCFPLDGALAFMKVLRKRYGWTNLKATPGFFGPSPPAMVGVDVAFNQTVQVPWGNCTVPKIDGTLSTGWTEDEGMPIFLLSAKVKRKHEKEVASIANEVRELIKQESIYHGCAIKVNYRDRDGERKDFNPSFAPRFIDTSTINRQEAIYSADTERAIEINLFNPILYSDNCRKHGIPLKRGVIMGGPYGTGKTLTAYKLAKLCVENKWTFLYLEDVRDLDLAISFAKLYEPCVLFAEDIDRATAGGSREAGFDKILNTIDGIESKNCEIMVVLTTNHLNHIHPAFLRPGRIDAILEISPPDVDACLRLIKKYGQDKSGELLMDGADDEFKNAITPMVGANASFIREAVERAKLSAISSSGEGRLTIRPNDISIVAKAMVAHIRMINPEHGKKSLLDLQDVEQVDPTTMAIDILVQKMSESFIDQIANPKTLTKIIKKKLGGKGGMFSSCPSDN